MDLNVLIKPFGSEIHHSSPNDEKIKVGLICNQYEENFASLQESRLNEYLQNLNSKSRNVMSKKTDPFISDVTTTDKTSMSHNWTIKQTHDNMSSTNEITFLHQQIAKQNSP